MDRSRLLSTRLRILAPLTAAGAVLLGSRRAQGQEATPAPRSAGTLESLLSMTPVAVLGDETPEIIATFADLAAQLAVVGVAPPASVEVDRDELDGWRSAISPLAIPSELQTAGFTLFTRDKAGFDLTDVDAILDAGEPPAKLWVLRGRFDADRLRETWLATGYQRLEVGGAEVFSLHADGEIDVSTEIGRFTFGRLNNATLLPDGSLVFAPTLELVERTLATVRGEEPSLAQRVDVRALLDAQKDDLVSGALFLGIALAGQFTMVPSFEPNAEGTPELFTEVEVDQQMLPIALGLVGMTGGGALPLPMSGEATPDPSIPESGVIYSLVMMQPGTAELAGEIASDRLATMESFVLKQPYREIFESWETEVLGDGQVLRLELRRPAGAQAGGWYQFLFNRDVLFLGW